ncbi:MAG: LamG-like jellyroll fold domain-containing protein [Candidatus Ornithomonoglobus sp.]
MEIFRAAEDNAVTVEAESGTGNFTTAVSGDKTYVADMPGSGDARENNYLEITAAVPRDGLYKMRVFQSNNDLCGTHSYNIKIIDKYATFEVNGDKENAKRYFFPNSFSDDTFLEKSIPIELKAGENKIRIYNDDSWHVKWGGSKSEPGTNELVNYTPNFDKFIIEPATADSPLNDEGFTVKSSATANGYIYTDKTVAQKGDIVTVYMIPNGMVENVTINGEDVTGSVTTEDNKVYSAAFTVTRDTVISAEFSDSSESDYKTVSDDNEYVWINGKCYKITGENLFKNGDFADNSGKDMEQWYTGTNESGHPTADNYAMPKINKDGTTENLIQLTESGIFTTGVYEPAERTPFYYGKNNTGTYLVDNVDDATGEEWRKCAWNGTHSLLAYVPIKENTDYYFKYKGWTSGGNAAVRYGAIDMDEGDNFYIPKTYAANQSLNFCGTGYLSCNNGDMQNTGGNARNYEAVINSGDGADYFLFNCYWLQIPKWYCATDFELREISSNPLIVVNDVADVPVIEMDAGRELVLPNTVKGKAESGKEYDLEVNWLNADGVKTYREGVYTVTGYINVPDGVYCDDRYIKQRVIVNGNTEPPTPSPIPTPMPDESDSAYLFAYFRKPAGQRDDERLCYGVSRDGYNFKALNGGEPVFESELGSTHLRDPFVFKGQDGYYYIVATDLWGTSTPNSTIVIYKTYDLIHMVDSILFDYKQFDGWDDMYHAWAPQVIWCPEHENEDGTKGAYMIYLSLASTSTDDNIGCVMYHSFTTDLMDASKYTAPELMLEGASDGRFIESGGAIDGDIIYDNLNNRYLMFFAGTRIAECDKPDGVFKVIEDKTVFDISAIEGSNAYRILGRNKWIIGADGTSWGNGYRLSETTDFETFTPLTQNVDYTFDFTPRHGYVIPISETQLQMLMDEYGEVDFEVDLPPFSNNADVITQYDFEEESLDNINAVFNGECELITDENIGSRTLHTNGSSGTYMEINAPKDEQGNTLERYTVSFDVNNNTKGNYFNFYIGDGSSNSSGINYFGVKLGEYLLLSSKNTSTENKILKQTSEIHGSWHHVDISVSDGTAKVYIDKKLYGVLSGYRMSDVNAEVIRFSFSPWSKDKYADAYYDNIVIYDNALSTEAVTADYSKLIEIVRCEADGNILTYEYSASENISNYDVYTAIYNGDGVLLKLIKNQLSGSIEITEDTAKVKVMTWEKGMMYPASTVIETAINNN